MLKISFPERIWIGGDKLEGILYSAKDVIYGNSSVFFEVLPESKILIDAAVIFLSLVNQLSVAGKTVTIDFHDEDSEVMGYFNRMGFFDHVDSRVAILPTRPSYSVAQLYSKSNKSIVEIVRIDQDDEELPGRLADALKTKDVKLGKAAFTIFGELIDNVLEHSSAKIDSYAALQTYKNGIMVIVSDSGKGLLATLRPKLPKKYKDASDIEIVIDAFEKGLSRHGRKSGRGCGLTTCAKKAKQFHGKLQVRLVDTRVNLVPSDDVYAHDTAYCYEQLLPIKGTHIAFDFSC